MINIKAKYDCLAGGYKKGDIFKVNRENDYYSFFDSRGDYRFRPINEFTIIEDEPSSSLSPIRTVARKEIVQGNYGIVAITKRNKVMIAAGKYDAEQIREAAHTLNQIAEALEDV